MKKIILIFAVLYAALMLSSCDVLKNQLFTYTNPLEKELSEASKIIFTNCKETALKFTVADPKVVEQVAGLVSAGRIIAEGPDVGPDYSIIFYGQNGNQYEFSYWMGVSENGREVNLKDNQGTYYRISDSLDTYITSSTKMNLRPSDFVKVYSSCITDAISKLQEDSSGETTVAVDVASDRRMRRYTMSYEDQRIISGITSDKFTILPYNDGSSYTYVVSFLTNIYTPTKAEIEVDAVKTADQTKQVFMFKPVYINGAWQTNLYEGD